MIAVFLVLLALWPALGMAAENFPPPEFSWRYQFPTPATPEPRPVTLAWVDMAVLAAVLLVALWVTYRSRPRSRQHLFVLACFGVAYFGFWRKGCVCSVGALQNVALSLTDPVYGLSLTVAVFFVLPLLVALFFGRAFCTGACPLGAAQEVVLLKPLRVPPWLDNTLSLFPWVYLGAAALFAVLGSDFIICRYDPFILFFRLGGTPLMLVIGAAILLLAVFVGRPYCRYLCPYGALLGLCARVAWRQIKLTHGDCIRCHLCADACPYGAIRVPTAEPGSLDRREGRLRLGLLIVAFPLLLVGGGYLGRFSSPFLARVDPTVRLAERVYLEAQSQAQGQVLEQTKASEAFTRQSGVPEDLYRQAAGIQGKYRLGGMVLGFWLALVFGARLIRLSVRRHHTVYDIDAAACVHCGRCFGACPVERARTAGNGGR
jgi:ferredoxin